MLFQIFCRLIFGYDIAGCALLAGSSRIVVKAFAFIVVGRRRRGAQNKSEGGREQVYCKYLTNSRQLASVTVGCVAFVSGPVMYRWWLVVVLVAGAAGNRLPRTSPTSAPSPAPSTRLPQRNFTISSRSSVRNRSVTISCSTLIHGKAWDEILSPAIA